MYRLNLRLDTIKERSREFLDGYERMYLDCIFVHKSSTE